MVDRSSTEWNRVKKRVQEKGLYGANSANTEVTLRFLEDLELGLNVGGTKGGRTPSRLVTITRRMSTLAYLVEHVYGADKRLVDVNERELLALFKALREGEVQSKKGPVKDVESLAKTFKQFWSWYIRAEKKAGRKVHHITEDLPTTNNYKPGWVYLTEKQIHELADAARTDYKTLIWFVIDSGARPQELAKLQVGDVETDEEGVTWLNIRHEVAKKNSFGRRIKLLVCNGLLKKYIQKTHLDSKGHVRTDNKLFPMRGETVKKYLRRRAVALWGDAISPARNHYRNISLYDLRHNSAVYWQNRYRSVNSLLYRFGWRDPKRLHYYSEAIGHQDKLEEEDLLINSTATQLEKELATEKQRRQRIEEEIEDLNKRLEIIDLWEEVKSLMPQDGTKYQPAPAGHGDKLSRMRALLRELENR